MLDDLASCEQLTLLMVCRRLCTPSSSVPGWLFMAVTGFGVGCFPSGFPTHLEEEKGILHTTIKFNHRFGMQSGL